jgi:hypothetical protein
MNKLTLTLSLLVGCATVSPEPSSDALKAPQLSPWPAGLSDPTESPDGVCFQLDLAKATHQRLLECSKLPSLCQLALDRSADACVLRLDSAQVVHDAQLKKALAQRSVSELGQWELWEVVIGIGIGTVAGLGLGYLFGAMAGP